jgi:hypothetical protein
MCIYKVWHTKKKETKPYSLGTKSWRGERKTDGYRTCFDLSQCHKAQLDRFTQYEWTHLQK